MEKNWLKHYPRGVPKTIDPTRFSSLVALFEETCTAYANAPAYVNFGKTLHYSEVRTLACAFASFLQHHLQLKKGDRIALVLPNILQYPVAIFGALLAGLVVVNVNPLSAVDELKQQLGDANVKCVLVLANFAKTLQTALPALSIDHVIVTKFGDLFDTPTGWLFNTILKFKRQISAYRIPGAIRFKRALKLGREKKPVSVDVTGDDIAFLQYTGGTTGVPKAAVLTHKNIVANIEQAHAWVYGPLREGREVMITALPLYHVFALTVNLFVAFRLGALSVLITDPRDINGVIKTLSEQPFSVMTGVNTLFKVLVEHPRFAALNFDALRLTIGGGMAVQESVAKKWHAVTGKPIIEGYGLTEASPIVCVDPVNLKEFNHSVGLPLPSTEVKIVDEKGQVLSAGEKGELCVKGPQVMREYWQNPSETDNVFTEDGWLKTGDIAKVDRNGFVYIVDRKKDMIVVSGFKVYPNEVEAVIAGLDGVAEVAVIDHVDANGNESVKAVVVRQHENVTKEKIIAHCREHLIAYKVPRIVEFRESLPKTSVGKVLRREVR